MQCVRLSCGGTFRCGAVSLTHLVRTLCGPWTTKADYLGSVGMARKTRSSMGTVGVRGVEVFPSARAICFAKPLSAGAAGLEESTGASPGCIEMRVVLGVQFGVFKQVSRRKTWRSPLLGVVVDGAVCGFASDDCESWLGVMATNAT